MKFAIIDDDMSFAENLQNRIVSLCDKNKYEAKIKCYEQAAPILEENQFIKYDIIFLDIDIPGIGGIDVAEKISKLRGNSLTPYIVFVTSQENLVFEALKILPYSFVRKSQLEDIDKCVISLCKRLSLSPTYSIKDGRGVRTIKIKDIIRIEKQRNYAVFYTTNGIYTERSNIDEKHRDLSQYHFLRPHIGILINAEHIKEYKKDDILMSDNGLVMVSRTYKKSFKEELLKWMRR